MNNSYSPRGHYQAVPPGSPLVFKFDYSQGPVKVVFGRAESAHLLHSYLHLMGQNEPVLPCDIYLQHCESSVLMKTETEGGTIQTDWPILFDPFASVACCFHWLSSDWTNHYVTLVIVI